MKLKLRMWGGASIFDNIKEEDQIIAFFPCVRFENQINLHLRGDTPQQKNWDYVQKLEYNIKLQKEVTQMYGLISKMVIVCLRKKLKLIIENPYSKEHYLYRYWCIKPKVIDYDRRERGDYYTKPTQYWFINCEPKNNLIFECIMIPEKKWVNNENKVTRSLLSPIYANRFLREFVLEERNE